MNLGTVLSVNFVNLGTVLNRSQPSAVRVLGRNIVNFMNLGTVLDRDSLRLGTALDPGCIQSSRLVIDPKLPPISASFLLGEVTPAASASAFAAELARS